MCVFCVKFASSILSWRTKFNVILTFMILCRKQMQIGSLYPIVKVKGWIKAKDINQRRGFLFSCLFKSVVVWFFVRVLSFQIWRSSRRVHIPHTIQRLYLEPTKERGEPPAHSINTSDKQSIFSADRSAICANSFCRGFSSGGEISDELRPLSTTSRPSSPSTEKH